jgi:hypothetical protein
LKLVRQRAAPGRLIHTEIGFHNQFSDMNDVRSLKVFQTLGAHGTNHRIIVIIFILVKDESSFVKAS